METINQLQLAMITSHNMFDNTLWTATSGNNNLLLTPRSLDPLALKQIVENMTLFEDLMYKDDHNLLGIIWHWVIEGFPVSGEVYGFTVDTVGFLDECYVGRIVVEFDIVIELGGGVGGPV